MKEKTRYGNPALLGVLILAAALPLLAFAQSQCLTDVSTTSSASKATTGTSVAISVTTTGSSCTINTLSLVSTPSLSVNDPASGQYSGLSAGTSKSFSVTAGTTGSYNYYARGTTSSGSVDSTSQILEYVSPSDMTVTTSPSAVTVASSNNFTLTINVQNPTSSDVSTSYTLNIPSGLTRDSGDPASSSGTTVSASSTKSLSFVIRHSTCFTGSKTITFDLGDTTGAASASVTGNSSCSSGSSDTSSSSTGGGSSSATSTGTTKTVKLSTDKVTASVSSISKGSSDSVEISDVSVSTLRKITISVSNLVKNIELVVTKSSNMPSSATSAVSGTVYKYITISKTNLTDADISAASIEFAVENSWITGNNIDPDKVAMNRFQSGSWSKLTTTKASSDSAYTYYTASSPGLSVFAVTGEAKASAPLPPAPPPAPPPAVTGGTTGSNQTAAAPPQGIDQTLLTVLIVALVAVAGSVYYTVTRKKKD